MPKGQQKGNREAKKPKQAKKPPAPIMPFAPPATGKKAAGFFRAT